MGMEIVTSSNLICYVFFVGLCQQTLSNLLLASEVALYYIDTRPGELRLDSSWTFCGKVFGSICGKLICVDLLW